MSSDRLLRDDFMALVPESLRDNVLQTMRLLAPRCESAEELLERASRQITEQDNFEPTHDTANLSGFWAVYRDAALALAAKVIAECGMRNAESAEFDSDVTLAQPSPPAPLPNDGRGETVEDYARALEVVPDLSAEHRWILAESGILPDVAMARKYRTVTSGAELQNLGFSPAQSRTAPGLLVPLYNTNGDLCGHQFRPDVPKMSAPRADGKQVPRKYETQQGLKGVLDTNRAALDLLKNPRIPLIITEGAKKLDAAVSRGLAGINIAGVWNWRGTNEFGGKTALAAWENVHLQGREIYIAFDSDVLQNPNVQKALVRLRAFLHTRGAILKVLYLPPGPHGEKTGLDDYFVRGGTVAELWQYAQEVKDEEISREAKIRKIMARAGEDNEKYPVIDVQKGQLRTRLRVFANAIGMANKEHTILFHGSSGMCHIAPDKDGQLTIVQCTPEFLQGHASGVATWLSSPEFGNSVRDAVPPKDLCSSLLHSPKRWVDVPSLNGIATAPVFSKGGVLCAEPGYNAGSKLWLEMPDSFKMPDIMPSEANVEAARSLIVDLLLGEVDFADRSSQAHAVALMILPFVRNMIEGPTPMHVIDAPSQSSGKSMLAKTCIAPFTRPLASAEKGDEEEWRKALLAGLLSGRSHFFFDNVRQSLKSTMLASCVTEPEIVERAMGGLTEVRVRPRCVWVVTSNNAVLDSDSASRALMIRLDTDMESPEGKVYSRNPLEYIERNRGQVVGAIITLVLNWIEQGKPLYAGGKQGRFAAWQRIIGGVLETAAIEGFLENLDANRDALDPEKAGWKALCEQWYAVKKEVYVPVRDLLPMALSIPEIAAALGDKDSVHMQKLGRQLQVRRDRKYGGFKILKGPPTAAGSTYRLELSGAAPAPVAPVSLFDAAPESGNGMAYAQEPSPPAPLPEQERGGVPDLVAQPSPGAPVAQPSPGAPVAQPSPGAPVAQPSPPAPLPNDGRGERSADAVAAAGSVRPANLAEGVLTRFAGLIVAAELNELPVEPVPIRGGAATANANLFVLAKQEDLKLLAARRLTKGDKDTVIEKDSQLAIIEAWWKKKVLSAEC